MWKLHIGTLQTLCVRAGGISDYFFIYTEQLPFHGVIIPQKRQKRVNKKKRALFTA